MYYYGLWEYYRHLTHGLNGELSVAHNVRLACRRMLVPIPEGLSEEKATKRIIPTLSGKLPLGCIFRHPRPRKLKQLWCRVERHERQRKAANRAVRAKAKERDALAAKIAADPRPLPPTWHRHLDTPED